jgi:hypothetical protein
MYGVEKTCFQDAAIEGLHWGTPGQNHAETSLLQMGSVVHQLK